MSTDGLFGVIAKRIKNARKEKKSGIHANGPSLVPESRWRLGQVDTE